MGVDHHGPNLYANCIVALNARTGERIWHFQEISHDIWDLDIPSPPNLTTITRHGIKVDVVAAVTKIGNTLLLDRVSGKPVFEFRRRRAPVSHLHGERTWPWQPDVELPQPFARQVFSLDDVTDISAGARESVMAKLIPGTSSRGANMGWFQPFEVGKSTAFYGIHGGAEWTGACIDPETGYLYVTSNELPWITMLHYLEQDEEDEASAPKSPGRLVYEANCLACHGARRQGLATAPPLLAVKYGSDKPTIMKLLETGRNLMPAFKHLSADQKTQVTDYLLGIEDHAKTEQKSQDSIFDKPPKYTFSGYIKLLDNEGHPGCKPPWGTLNCIDLNTGLLRWKVPLGEYAELTKRGIPKTGTENFGGASVTAGGLVFAGGTRDHKIRAFNKWTGEELWSAELPYGGYAPPTIYQVNGREHVVIPATGGGKLGGAQGDAFVAFALP
ncbi:MAG: c-type cytochrome [Verrucomicrobia bacterium]|nr:c-type cytochrome [Verrucomicrobiota bacterium]